MSQLDIYVCTKSKCTAKRVQVKLCESDTTLGSYNGSALLDAIRELVEKKKIQGVVTFMKWRACQAVQWDRVWT